MGLLQRSTESLPAPVRRVGRPLKRAALAARGRLEEQRNPALHWLRQSVRDAAAGPEVWDTIWDNRRRLVRELAPGKSFLDLGGMFFIDGDIAFLAEECGASRVVLFDAMDPSDAFAEKHEAKGSNVHFVQGDFHDPYDIEQLGTFDVVWCCGVIYHTPHPIQQIQHLRQLTRHRLVLGSLVVPEVPGFEQAALLYPGMSPSMRATFTTFAGGTHTFPGMTVPFDEEPLMAYVNMWFGLTPSIIRAMLVHTGFEPIEDHQVTPFSYDVVAKLGGVSPDIYPPRFQSQGRALARYEGVPDEKLPAYAAEQVRALRAHPPF
ncbi:MAG: class I SAM-dependent methyltransferase [Acidimicrobiales bacterium]